MLQERETVMAMPVHLPHWQERSDMIHMWYAVVFREPEMELEMVLQDIAG